MSDQSATRFGKELLEAHDAWLDKEHHSELEQFGTLLEAQTAETVRYALEFGRPPAFSTPRETLLSRGWCRTLDPVFSVESAPLSDSSSGEITRYSRADANARTLDVGAATGQLGGVQYPSSETFILGFNRASASIGASVHLGPHGPGMSLEVSVQLEILSWPDLTGATFTGSGLGLLYVNGGFPELPLGGASVAWCHAGLSIMGRGGKSSGVRTEIASTWVNGDASSREDGAPDGLIRLSHRVGLDPELAVAGVFISLSAFAGAEESQSPVESAFAQMNAFPGAYPPFIPSRLHVKAIDVRICEPVFAPTSGRVLEAG
ncbi:hypothetical protein J2Y41_004654 [Arthrobacter sp. 1088]|uniref:hypothetical protein n=1 Tax=Arthrobacter sp. 1088 TaxID=2817768 RepID=UPI00285C5648|nr:hypothetical protein [Arthrobacter sp. 1088]MDR6689050.1 hypothetical protein [Arthrobacter sp. 1088]